MHLKNWQINSTVQYQMNSNEFFQISEAEFQSNMFHIESCENCEKAYLESLKAFKDIQAQNRKSLIPFRKLTSIAASILLVSSLLFFFSSENKLDTSRFIALSEFNFMIKRSASNKQLENNNKWVYYLNEGQFKDLIKDCESKGLEENNLHYLSALILLGQDEDKPEYLEKALTSITADSLEHWKLKILRILKKDEK
jgi:hypothetical protein